MFETRTNPDAITTDILIVGAGPAGCAAAITLALAGRRVLLIDQHDFPRDKVCGDGLIPDSMQALERLGVLEEVLRTAQRVKGVACHGPKGGTLYVPSDLAVLPRQSLDACLFDRAKAVGATTMTGMRYLAPLKDANDQVVGAHVKIDGHTTDGHTHELYAKWTILATGANLRPLQATGHCTEPLPSAMALRAYIHHPDFKNDGKPIEHLHISWHKSYAPGYGWLFPCPNGLYNVGVGLYGMHQRRWRGNLAKLPGLKRLQPSKPNLAELFDRFIQSNPLARRLVETGTQVGNTKGAPLRCSLQGAKPAMPGLLITGEAMGSTYALTGEGIGKAMETGMLCAQALLEHQNEQAVCQAYEQHLHHLAPKFTIYQQANKINRLPWLIDLAIARGNQSPQLVHRMSRVLEEKANPAKLFTLQGAWKFLTE